MSRCERPEPRPDNPHEMRIRAVVDALVTEDSEKATYIQFARELTRSSRHASPSGAFPDFSIETKRIVAKWFRRGLSGHLLWLIGKELIPVPEVRNV
jgi:hypothetical protein